VFFQRDGQELPEEFEFLSGLLTGSRGEESWLSVKEECDFFDLKGAVEMLLNGLGISNYIFSPAQEETYLHPGKACRIQSAGRTLGVMGEVHPEVNEAFDLEQKIFLFELNFQNCLDSKYFRRKYKPIARYPYMTRDLACIVDKKRAAGDLWQALWEVNNGWIKEIRLFDVYEGNPIPSGKKSLAFRIRYQREDRTLTDGEVDEVHKKLIANLVHRFGAILR
jgi:phenylalanyl-tRNA synthetase beta chain